MDGLKASAFFFLFAFPALASPRLGDYVIFDLDMRQGLETRLGTLSLEIVESSGKKVLQRKIIEMEGSAPEQEEQWLQASELMDDATVRALLSHCEANGGVRERLQSPRGALDSCALPFNNKTSKGKAWIAQVPFGLARVESERKSDGTQMNTALRDFRLSPL